MVSEFLLTPSANVACAVYAGVFGIINIAYNWLWFAASRNLKLVNPEITEQQIKKVVKNYLLAFPFYVIAFIAAFFNVYVSLGICMLLWIYWAVIMKLD